MAHFRPVWKNTRFSFRLEGNQKAPMVWNRIKTTWSVQRSISWQPKLVTKTHSIRNEICSLGTFTCFIWELFLHKLHWTFVQIYLNFISFNLQALLLCLVAVAYVSAAPAPAPEDELIIGDSVDAFHPADDTNFSKKAIIKGIIIHKVKKIKKKLKG